MQLFSNSAISLVVSLGLWISSAAAESIVVEIGGVFTEPEIYFSSIQPGDVWSARTVLDVQAPDNSELDWVGAYDLVVTSEFSFDGFTWTNPGLSAATIWNNNPLPIEGIDSLSFFYQDLPPYPTYEGVSIGFFAIRLVDDTEAVFQSDLLSEIIGINLGDFGETSLQFEGGGPSIGYVTSLSITQVPVPSAAPLLATALGLLSWVRRKPL